MTARYTLGSGMVILLSLASGCGMADRIALVNERFRTPPTLTAVDVSVRPFATVTGLGRMTRQSLQDALFAAQAGSRSLTLQTLQTAEGLVANDPARSALSLGPDGIKQLRTDLAAGTVSAQTVATQLETALRDLGPEPTTSPSV
jgi:hypothetical protein